jgi:lysophospholipase L1-like esterase
MSSIKWALAVALAAAFLVETAFAGDGPAQRIVFLGDSITDGNTLAELVHQAFADAGETPPVCINAGVGGDTAAQMLKRLDRDVLPRRLLLIRGFQLEI